MDGYFEFVCKSSTEDGFIRVVEIYYIKGHVLYSHIFLASEGNRQGYFSQCIDPLSSEAN